MCKVSCGGTYILYLLTCTKLQCTNVHTNIMHDMLLGDLKLPIQDKMTTSPTVVHTGTPKEGTRYTLGENGTTPSGAQYSSPECPYSECEA